MKGWNKATGGIGSFLALAAGLDGRKARWLLKGGGQ